MIGHETAYISSTIILIVFQVVGSITVPIFYVKLIAHLWKAGEGLVSNQSQRTIRNKVVTVKVVVAAIVNLLCWLPSSGVFIVMLSMSDYHVQLPLFTLVIAMPINFLLNPILFNLNFTCIFEKFKEQAAEPPQKLQIVS